MADLHMNKEEKTVYLLVSSLCHMEICHAPFPYLICACIVHCWCGCQSNRILLKDLMSLMMYRILLQYPTMEICLTDNHTSESNDEQDPSAISNYGDLPE